MSAGTLGTFTTTIDEVMKGGTAGTFAVTTNKEGAATLAPDPAAVPLTFKNDFLKATNNLIYVPFVVTMSSTSFAAASGSVAREKI